MVNVNTPILSLPPAIGSLTGTEVIPLVQAGTTKSATTKQLGSVVITANFPATIEYVMDGGGSVLTIGMKGYLVVPFNCTIQSVTLLSDKVSSISVDIWKTTQTAFDAGITSPTSANSITSVSPPTIASTTKYFDQSLVNWISSLGQSDVLAFNIISINNVARATLSLQCQRSLL